MPKFTINPQTVEDLFTGITLQFETRKDGEFAVYLSGEHIQYGNRTLVFDAYGNYAGSGTHTAQSKPE